MLSTQHTSHDMQLFIHCITFLALQLALQNKTIGNISIEGTIHVTSSARVIGNKLLQCKTPQPCVLDFSHGHRIEIFGTTNRLVIQSISFVNGHWDSTVPALRYGNMLIQNGGEAYISYCTFQNNTFAKPTIQYSGSIATLIGVSTLLHLDYSTIYYTDNVDIKSSIHTELGSSVHYNQNKYVRSSNAELNHAHS